MNFEITPNSFVEVDAREIQPGDIIDRGERGVVLLRIVEGARPAIFKAGEVVQGAPDVKVTEIVHRKLGETALSTMRICEGGKVRRLIK